MASMRILVALSLIFAICGSALAQELQPGDTIAIAVYQDSKLDRQVVIGPTGSISFPLAGQIRAAGQTPQALEKLLKARLRDKYTTELDVTVTLVTAGKMEEDLKPRFYVTGEVPRPGPYVIRTKTTVLQAIALAGGLGPFAAKQRIQIRREVDGVETLLLFDYRAFEAGTNLENNVELRANDVIIVPERRLFE
jgi:polysaccharide export outer membrane protein